MNRYSIPCRNSDIRGLPRCCTITQNLTGSHSRMSWKWWRISVWVLNEMLQSSELPWTPLIENIIQPAERYRRRRRRRYSMYMYFLPHFHCNYCVLFATIDVSAVPDADPPLT